MHANLELYRVFLAVAKTGSFSAAASALFITQPAVSQAVKQLETVLGGQLFVRTPKGVRLTQGGELMLGYAENALGMIASGEQRLGELRNLKGGTLRIGASDTLCRYYLLPYLKEFHRLYPDINITVTNRTSGETAALLESGKADLGFVNLPLDIEGDIGVRNLAPVQDCFVYGERYYGELGSVIPLSRLSAYPLLMLERQSTSRRYLDAVLSRLGVRLTPQIELGSLDLLLEFAAAGLGIAAVSREYAEEYITDGRLRVLEVSPCIPPRHIGMIFHKKMPLSYAAQAFLALLE